MERSEVNEILGRLKKHSYGISHVTNKWDRGLQIEHFIKWVEELRRRAIRVVETKAAHDYRLSENQICMAATNEQEHIAALKSLANHLEALPESHPKKSIP